VHVAYGCGSVLLWHSDKIPRGRGNFGGCPGHSKALVIFTAAVAAVFAAKASFNHQQRHAAEEIIQYARQAQIEIWKNLSTGDVAYQPGRG